MNAEWVALAAALALLAGCLVVIVLLVLARVVPADDPLTARAAPTGSPLGTVHIFLATLGLAAGLRRRRRSLRR